MRRIQWIIGCFWLFSCTKENVAVENPAADNATWTMESHSNDAQPNYAVVFPQYSVNTIEITLGKTVWEAIKTDMVAKNKGVFGSSPGQGGGPPVGGGGPPAGGGGGGVPSFGEEPDYVEATIKFNDRTWNHVGFRLKGNSTLSSTWKSGIYKLPFRLKFDEYEDTYKEIDNQRFYGFKDLTFSAAVKDNSLIREKVTADIFRQAGIPAARTSFIKVYIDFGEGLKYCGVYTLVEAVDDTMLADQYGEKKGNLYKPESNFSTFTEAAFPKKNNTTTADYTDVKNFVTALNASNRTSAPDAWRKELENHVNMDHFVKWLAINTVLVNWDTYGAMAHNHYFYQHSSKKLMWIPWDNNEALTSAARVNIDLKNVSSQWPLINYVANDPVYYQKYKTYVKDFNDNVFTTSQMNAIFDNATNLISPYVTGTEKETSPYTNLSNSAAFTSALALLKSHVVARNKVVADFVK